MDDQKNHGELLLMIVLEHMNPLDIRTNFLISKWAKNYVDQLWQRFTQKFFNRTEKFFPDRNWTSLCTNPLFRFLGPYARIQMAERNFELPEKPLNLGGFEGKLPSQLELFLSFRHVFSISQFGCDMDTIDLNYSVRFETESYMNLSEYDNNSTVWLFAVLLKDLNTEISLVDGDKIPFEPRSQYEANRVYENRTLKAGSVVIFDLWEELLPPWDQDSQSILWTDEWFNTILKGHLVFPSMYMYRAFSSLSAFFDKYLPYIQRKRIGQLIEEVRCGYPEQMKQYLNDPNLDFTQLDADGRSILHLACFGSTNQSGMTRYRGTEELPRKHEKVFDVCLAVMPREFLFMTDDKGQTPLQIAEDCGFEYAVNKLKEIIN